MIVLLSFTGSSYNATSSFFFFKKAPMASCLRNLVITVSCIQYILLHLSTTSSWSLHFNFSSVQFSCSVVSNALRPHELQHARPPSPSPTPRVHPNPCPNVTFSEMSSPSWVSPGEFLSLSTTIYLPFFYINPYHNFCIICFLVYSIINCKAL